MTKRTVGTGGVAGVDADGTLLDVHEEKVTARQAILANCRQAYLVPDAGKFSRPAHVRGGHVTDVTAVVCDSPPPDALCRQLQRAGTHFVVPAEAAEATRA